MKSRTDVLREILKELGGNAEIPAIKAEMKKRGIKVHDTTIYEIRRNQRQIEAAASPATAAAVTPGTTPPKKLADLGIQPAGSKPKPALVPAAEKTKPKPVELPEEGLPKVATEPTILTPKVAEELLQQPSGNRKLSEANIRAFAADFEQMKEQAAKIKSLADEVGGYDILLALVDITRRCFQ